MVTLSLETLSRTGVRTRNLAVLTAAAAAKASPHSLFVPSQIKAPELE